MMLYRYMCLADVRACSNPTTNRCVFVPLLYYLMTKQVSVINDIHINILSYVESKALFGLDYISTPFDRDQRIYTKN